METSSQMQKTLWGGKLSDESFITLFMVACACRGVWHCLYLCAELLQTPEHAQPDYE